MKHKRITLLLLAVLLAVVLIPSVIAQNPPVRFSGGTAAPASGACDAAAEVGAIYIQTGDPASVVNEVWACRATGASSWAWHPISHFAGTTLPTTCTDGQIAVDTNASSGQRFYACESGSWVVQGAAGSGTVTSVGLVGTANQLTVTGTSPITGAGSWTISIPTNPTLPGTTTGTFSGPLTGNVTGNVSGTAATFTGSLTGDVTSSGMATTLANIPTAVPMAGYLGATAITAPGTPAAGIGNIYVDSTSKNVAVKDDAGVVKHGVQTTTATGSQWFTAVSAAGVFTKAQPAFTDISGAATDAQVPNTITIDLATLATTATTANAGDSATAFFSAGQIEAARGGTGIDTSGSTGVPRIASGTWTADAGISHLASSTSAHLATVLSDETGTGGGFVRATEPTMTGPVIGNLAEATCDSSIRGKITVVQGGTGVADTVRVCTKDASDSYSWRPLV